MVQGNEAQYFKIIEISNCAKLIYVYSLMNIYTITEVNKRTPFIQSDCSRIWRHYFKKLMFVKVCYKYKDPIEDWY